MTTTECLRRMRESVFSAEEVELLRKWISEGAAYAEHWAFVPPGHPADAEWFFASRVGAESHRPIRARAIGAGGIAAERSGGAGDPDPQGFAGLDRPAADDRRRGPIRHRLPARTRTSGWWIVCWLPRRTANVGHESGWTWPATPTRRATPRIPRGRSGVIATGSSGASTPTCRSISSRSSRSRATCCPSRPKTS